MGLLPRKSILLVAILLVPAASGIGARLGDEPPADLQPDMLDLAGYDVQTTLVDAEHLPAPSASTGIGPGSRLLITMAGGQYGCTANFIWTDGSELYLGTAGHCLLPTGRRATHGPGADWSAANTIVDVCVANCYHGGFSGFIFTGTMVRLGPATYARQSDSSGTVGNDFGVVRIPPSLYGHIRTSMPVWGGPTSGMNPSNILGQPVCQFGHGVGVGEVFATQAKMGVGLLVYSTGRYDVALNAAPGDSGSPTVICGNEGLSGWHGKSPLGIHTHSAAYTPYKYGTTIAKAKSMTLRDTGMSISVVTGP